MEALGSIQVPVQTIRRAVLTWKTALLTGLESRVSELVNQAQLSWAAVAADEVEARLYRLLRMAKSKSAAVREAVLRLSIHPLGYILAIDVILYVQINISSNHILL